MAPKYPTRNDLPEQTRDRMVSLLNQQLADTFDMYSQLKQAHWNVKGLQFFQLHELFDTLASDVFGYIDTIAERVTILGGTAKGTLRMAGTGSTLPEYPEDIAEGKAHLVALTERMASLAASTRKAIGIADEVGDADTADLFTAVSRDVDKALWFLESHLVG